MKAEMIELRLAASDQLRGPSGALGRISCIVPFMSSSSGWRSAGAACRRGPSLCILAREPGHSSSPLLSSSASRMGAVASRALARDWTALLTRYSW
jgi:hypothetical protein